MNVSDQFMLALTAWRENRGGGRTGMQSVMNVVMNRAAKSHETPYQVCVARLQFSSITARADPQLVNWPLPADPQWQTALALAESAVNGELADITNGATSYYALSMKVPPYWAASMTPTAEIAGQKFFREAA